MQLLLFVDITLKEAVSMETNANSSIRELPEDSPVVCLEEIIRVRITSNKHLNRPKSSSTL